MSDGHISILGKRKKVCSKYITDFLWNTFLLERKIVWYNHQHYPHIKNGIEWLKYECPSDAINFRCFLLKADFRIFYFELETLLNKLVKLCDYFFRKIFLNKNAECLIFIKKVNLLTNRAFTENSNISMNFLYIDGLHLLYSGKELLAKNFYFNIKNFLRKHT